MAENRTVRPPAMTAGPGHGVPAGRHGDAALQRVEKALDRRRDAVDLRHCAHAEQADRRPDGCERHGEPAPAQPLLDVAEWPAEPFPACRLR